MSATATRPRPGYLRLWIWLTYGALAAVGIPWYWPRDPVRLILGLPAWALVSIAASLLVSMFTAWLIWSRWPVDDSEISEDPSAPEDRA